MTTNALTDYSQLLPVVHFLKIPEEGTPYLEGLKCSYCHAVYTDRRRHCAKCHARDALKPFRFSHTGKVHAYTIVHRSFPGIKVPHISAIVDMDGGGVVKANLINIEPDPKKIPHGLEVELVFEQAPYGDKEGNDYLLYAFQPRN